MSRAAVRGPAARVAPGTWTGRVVRDLEGLRTIRDDIDGLYRASRDAMPFLAPGWLEAWWSVYGRRGRLRVVTVWEDDVLRAVAPFHEVHRCGLRVLVPLGGALADHTDVLLDGSPQAARCLVQTLLGLADVVDLPEVAPASSIRRLVGRWPWPVLERPSSTSAVLPARPIEEILAGLSSRTRGHRRRELRSVTAAAVHQRTLRVDEVGGGVATLLTLHRAAWEGRAITPEHTRARFADFLTRAARAMVRAGDAALVEHRVEDDVVAVELVLLGRNTAGGYIYGHRPELRDTVNVTAMLLTADLALAAERGLDQFSMLRGGEAYKDRWHPDLVPHSRLVLPLRPAARVRAYVAAVRGLERLRTRVRQDAQLRTAVARLRSARRALSAVARGAS